MISDSIRLFIGKAAKAFVASVDDTGAPHLAAGSDPTCPDSRHLAFEAWFCHTTLRNTALNPRVAVAVVEGSGKGYQFVGTVEKLVDTAFLDGLPAGKEAPGMPQVRSRLLVRVDGVMDFSVGVHTDLPL